MMLEADKLCAWYGAAQILFDVSFDVGRGEVVALMGRNGAGKSTTLKAIMGLVGRRAGGVRFDGTELLRLETFQIARLGLGSLRVHGRLSALRRAGVTRNGSTLRQLLSRARAVRSCSALGF